MDLVPIQKSPQPHRTGERAHDRAFSCKVRTQVLNSHGPHPPHPPAHTGDTQGGNHRKRPLLGADTNVVITTITCSLPALTFIIRTRRHTLVLLHRRQKSRPGAVSGAAAACATPNTHLTTPGDTFCCPSWKEDTTSGLLSLLSAYGRKCDFSASCSCHHLWPPCDGPSSLWNQKPKSTLLSVALAMVFHKATEK